LKPHPEERALARVSKDGPQSQIRPAAIKFSENFPR
jgi:hypothetical protein